MAVPRTEAAEEVENLTGLGDGMADVAQIIGEALELGAVVVDAQVTLLDAAELRLEVDSTLELVVAEERLDVAPEGERRGVRLVDDVEDGLLDGVVEPIDDAIETTRISANGNPTLCTSMIVPGRGYHVQSLSQVVQIHTTRE
jgi:hypothetical protein